MGHTAPGVMLQDNQRTEGIIIGAGGCLLLSASPPHSRAVLNAKKKKAVDGSWRLAVGGPLGLSLRAVLSKKKKKKISFLKDAPAPQRVSQ